MLKELMALLGGAAGGGMPPGGAMPGAGGADPRAAILASLSQAGGAPPMRPGATAVPVGESPPLGDVPMANDPDLRTGDDEDYMPQDDPNPDQNMLNMISDSMGGATDFSAAKRKAPPQRGPADPKWGETLWQGARSGVPTARDLKIVQENPTDGMINDFIKTFPDYEDAQSLAQGTGGMATHEGDYAIGGDEIEAIYKNRKTKVDER